MKIIDKNILKVASHTLNLSREKYKFEKTDGEIILFSNSLITKIERYNKYFSTNEIGDDGKILHPTVVMMDGNEVYQDYRYTELIYSVESTSKEAKIEVNIPYAHNLSTVQAKNSSVFILNDNEWYEIKTLANTDSKVIQATIDISKMKSEKDIVFAVFYNHFWHSNYTQQLADNFPSWSYIYKSKESNGQRFLNYFGIEVEELREHFKWIDDQHFIGTADLTQMDWVYVYGDRNQVIENNDEIVSYSSGIEEKVKLIDDVEYMQHNTSNEGVMVDYEKSILYSQYDYGKIYLKKVDSSLVELPKRLHQIWNVYDEFGLLLGVKRIFGEKNYRFYERILDVFRYPSNTSELGLTHGIARELDLIQRYSKDEKGNEVELEWKDDSKPLILKNTSGMILDHRTLRIDTSRKLSEGIEYEVDKNGNIKINPLNEYTSHRIHIVQGIEKYELHDEYNDELFEIMYEDDGLASPQLENWVNYIRKIAPIMWDDFKWDKGYWDTINKELTGLGYIPNHWDGNIDNWKGYYVYE